MDSQPGRASALRSPERWLAVLRIAIGVWFAKALFTKLSVTLLWGFLPVPTASERWMHVMPTLLGKYAEGNPVGFFRDFLTQTVLPHSRLFAQLTAYGEAAVGTGLVLGLLTPFAAGVGLFLVLNYFLAVQWQGSSQQGFHYVLAVSLIVILATGAGQWWGLDGWLRARRDAPTGPQGT
jgi:thiosulfate dehydrogenase [quinone] large subunit